MSLDKEIVTEFVTESKGLVKEALELLESIEGDFLQVKSLRSYGNSVDRIMGGAKSLALMADRETAFTMIGDYTALLKAVSYKASHIQDNSQFYDICVALLLDATENLEILLDKIDLPMKDLKAQISETFIERVRWVSEKFTAELSGSVGTGTSNTSQSEIDELMKKLGL